MTVARHLIAHQKRILKHLQAERVKQGLSYARLSAAAGVDPVTIHGALTGSTPAPSFITIEAIANALGFHHELP